MQLNSRRDSKTNLKKIDTYLRNEIRSVQNKINHICSVRSHKLYDSMRRSCRGRAPAESKRIPGDCHILDKHYNQFLTECLPFIQYHCMPRSSLWLWRCRNKTGLNEELLLRPGFGRNLEVENLASFIDIRLCRAGPGRCRKYEKHLSTSANETCQPNGIFDSRVILTIHGFYGKGLDTLRKCH